MAHFLLRNQHGHGARRRVAPSRRRRIRSAAFSAASRPISSGSAQGYLGLLQLALALGAASRSPSGFICVALLSLGSCAVSWPAISFRCVDSAAIKIHMRAPTGTRIEEATAPRRSGRAEDPHDHSAGPARQHRRQHRPADQRHQYLLRQHRNDRRLLDADILVTLSEGKIRPPSYVKALREQLPKAFPGTTFSYPAGRHRHPDPQLRLACAAPRPDRRRRSQREPRLRQPAPARKYAAFPGVADPRIQEAFQSPALKIDFNRELAGVVGPHRAMMLRRASRRRFPGAPRPLRPTGSARPTAFPIPSRSRPRNIDIDTLRRSEKPALDGRPVDAASRADSRHSRPSRSTRLSRTTTSEARVNIYATTQDRDLGGVAADIQKIVDDSRGDLPKGSTVAIRGQAATMTSAYSAASDRLGFLGRADLPPHRRQLPGVARSVRHHHRASSRAGWIVWMLFSHPHQPLGPRADRRDHVHGRRDRQQHPRRQLRPRAARGRQGRGRRGARGWRRRDSARC